MGAGDDEILEDVPQMQSADSRLRLGVQLVKMISCSTATARRQTSAVCSIALGCPAIARTDTNQTDRQADQAITTAQSIE